MRKALHCTACGAQLSRPLRILSLKDPAVGRPEHEPEKPLSDPGTAYKSYEPIERSYSDQPARLEFAPQYWINPEDLDKSVRWTRKRKRMDGCCGVAGANGPNKLCACGAEIGTHRTDCWTSRVFIPEPAATYWNEES
ncbi:hypothetical protein [Sphingomonas sp. G-3-2-10]|uniref:hypothetical protein n=1 Tax=Sphingomonas sp. G-3-2-10 TaxID=2728838 RepID=UPI00146EBE44|nr:hypothetical protein [Sphingomonas sp. G-3-2-10]NML08516.1 hypothetical protein [Sphingomonas sp. G-3-2-10]